MNKNKYKKFKMLNSKLKLYASIFIIFATALILVYSTYAWFRSTANVRINDLSIVSVSDDDMLISLDAINFSDHIEINSHSIITELNDTYPTHVNQWARSGLLAVSSAGLPNIHTNKFSFWKNKSFAYEKANVDNDLKLNIVPIVEDVSRETQLFVAFDLFIKNSTPSPYGDYLYFDNDTGVVVSNTGGEDENTDSIRIGLSITPSIDKKAPVEDIQTLGCNPGCSQIIYEPNHTSHTINRLEKLAKHGIFISDGDEYPTYAVVQGDPQLEIWSGVINSGKELDLTHFAKQETIFDDQTFITILRNDIIKVRIYIWVEAQDIDTVERKNDFSKVDVLIKLRKELIK